MGRAFSEEERDEIKIALMESALELFHDRLSVFPEAAYTDVFHGKYSHC